jgi:NTP pyrophosphatase (non-canonical NTP hydrolase)/nucleoside 2-deoxyribosyltransferase
MLSKHFRMHRVVMPRSSSAQASNQILLFPTESQEGTTGPASYYEENAVKQGTIPRTTSVVLCGTYRKDPEGLLKTFELLTDLGFSVLSPSNVRIESEKDGFVYMHGESTQSPHQLESNHLDAIQRADFVWFFAPGGYVGPTGALEVGFARANGIPVYTDESLDDPIISKFVELVESPSMVQDSFRRHHHLFPPSPAVRNFQNYYRRVALQRGYASESPKDCVLLMVEEIGELARAIRKREKLTRHGFEIRNEEALELADVFLYVVHLANILKLDLSRIVQEKEFINIQKLISAK